MAASGFRWLSGEDALRSYRVPGWTGTRVFCGTCGSSLGGRDERWPDFIVVNAGTLDDDPGTRPLYHIYVGSKAPEAGWSGGHRAMRERQMWVAGASRASAWGSGNRRTGSAPSLRKSGGLV